MKIACTGPHGHVGSSLVDKGVIPLDIKYAQDSKETATNIRRAIKKVAPDVVINAAAKSGVIWCEDKKNTEEAISTNVRGPYLLATECEKLKIPMVALSTDCVFRGRRGPYKEDDGDLLPVNFYGETKLAMEFILSTFDSVKIVRTSNLFWKEDPRVLWYLNEAYKSDKVKVPTFQKRSFMHLDHFVDNLLDYVYNKLENSPQIVHISGSKTTDWLTFLRAFCVATEFSFTNKFVRKWFDDKKMIPRPKKAGLDTSLSAKLGLKQYSYLDGLELLK